MTQRFVNPLRLVNLPSPPAEPQPGWMYYDTTHGQARIWNGVTWMDIGGPNLATTLLQSMKYGMRA